MTGSKPAPWDIRQQLRGANCTEIFTERRASGNKRNPESSRIQQIKLQSVDGPFAGPTVPAIPVSPCRRYQNGFSDRDRLTYYCRSPAGDRPSPPTSLLRPDAHICGRMTHDLILSLCGVGLLMWIFYELAFGGGRNKGANGDGGGGGGSLG